MNKRFSLLLAISVLMLSGCGLQLLDANQNQNILPAVPGNPTETFTIRGKAEGVVYTGVAIPTGYNTPPNQIGLNVNNEENYWVDEDGAFILPREFFKDEPYSVELIQNNVEVTHIEGLQPSVFFNCIFYYADDPFQTCMNDISGIVENNIDNIVLSCWLGDSVFVCP